MLNIQKFLSSGFSLEELESKFAISAKRHPKYPNLILLKYDQINSPFSEQIVRECRGIILDESNDWSIVSFPFTKFFNYGEGHAASIDWNTARTQEKVDGSLATIYPYDGKWHVSTTGTPDASGNVSDFDFTFEKLFWNAFSGNLPSVDCNKCFFFELTSAYNKIVVRYTESSLTLLGGRDLITKVELTTKEAHGFFPQIKAVKEFPLSSIEECIATFESMSPVEQEGYVIVDAQFNRIKIKHPGYIALHHMKDGLGSKKALVEVVRNGEISEVVNAFPEYESLLNDTKGKLDSLVLELESEYEKIKHIENQKEFALEALKTRCSGALFSLRAKKVANIRTYLKEMRIDSVMELIG